MNRSLQFTHRDNAGDLKNHALSLIDFVQEGYLTNNDIGLSDSARGGLYLILEAVADSFEALGELHVVKDVGMEKRQKSCKAA